MTALEYPSGCLALAVAPRRRIPRAVPAGNQWMGPHGMVTVLRPTFYTVSHTGGTTSRRRFLATHYQVW